MDGFSEGAATVTDATNDPALTSWCESAQGSDFPIQNLPFGVIEVPDWGPRLAVAIGGYALDLYACAQLGYFDSVAEDVPELGAALPKVFRRRFARQAHPEVAKSGHRSALIGGAKAGVG